MSIGAIKRLNDNEQPGVKVDADDLCWQWDPKQLLAFAKKAAGKMCMFTCLQSVYVVKR